MNIAGDRPPSGRIFLMRHGDSRKDSIKRYLGQSDDPLNDRGREQAEWWRARFSSIRFGRVFCSNLARSMQTARIIMSGREGLVTPLEGLREIAMGDWDGLAMADVRARQPAEFAARGMNPDSHRPPGGESFADLLKRVIPVFRGIFSLDPEERTVLVIGHAGVNRALLCHVLGMPLKNLFLIGQDYCCLNILGRGGGTLRVDAVNLPPFDGLKECSVP